ncbi:MAG: Methyltransferase type 12 [Verrucomicrobiaceae bacterium]|nr:Methyltransferase type 12 [Verrucomicrobiaceae bacterium]
MSFDILAPHYRWMEWLLAGGKLQRCRIAFLKAIPPPSNVLIYGEGNGRFLAALLHRFPGARVTCVDASAAMLEKARQRLLKLGPDHAGVDFVHADALQWHPPAATFDLVVTHFFLDCFREDQLLDLILRISQAAKPRAQWLLGDFKVADRGVRRLRSRLILALMYAFFRRATRLPARQITAPDKMLSATGFKRTHRIEIDWGMLHSDVWER